MELIKLVVALVIFESTLGVNLLMQKSLNSHEISNYVCKAAQQIAESKLQTHDILIGNLGTKNQPTVTNYIIKCLNDINGLIITDLQEPVINKNLRRASVIIIEIESVNMTILQSMINTHFKGSVWHHMAKIIFIVPSTISLNVRLQILIVFKKYGFLDVAVVHQNQNEDIQFEIFPSMLQTVRIGKNVPLTFPDKRKNMNGQPLNVVLYLQSARVRIINNKISTPMMHFLNAVSKVRKLKYNIQMIQKNTDIKKFWLNREMDLTLSSAIIINSAEPKLLTYEEDSYSVLIPIPPKISICQFMLIKPFDWLTWMFLLITVSVCVFVWWMFCGRGAVESPWLIAYGMFIMLIGQGVDFSRRNRLVLVILLQLIIVMIFILNIMYEGVITSFMITPIHEHRFKTFDEVLTSSYDFNTDQNFISLLKNSNEYKFNYSRMSLFDPNTIYPLSKLVLDHKLVIIMKSGVAEYYSSNKLPNGLMLLDFYYILPTKMMPRFISLEASFQNPYIQMLQKLMDLCFEAGLPQIWKIFELLNQNFRPDSVNLGDSNLLRFKDLIQVFGFLLVGYVLSILVLLIEIFFYDILSSLQLGFLARRLRNRINQIAYRKRKQPQDVKYQKVSSIGKNLQVSKVLPNYACQITKDIIKTKSHTQDVLIGNLKNQSHSSMINDIAECMTDTSALVISNLQQFTSELSLRKAAVIILEFDWITIELVQSLVKKLYMRSVWYHMTRVICIVSKIHKFEQRLLVLVVFKFYGFLDVAVIHQTDIGDIVLESFESIHSSKVKIGINDTNTSVIFSDKLKDMNEYPLDVVLHTQPTRVILVNNRISTPMIHFLDVASKARNLKPNVKFIKDYSFVKQFWVDRKMHLTLNSAFMINSTDPKLLTYQEESYCVLLPLPPKTSIFQFMLIEPFDGLTWFFLLLTIFACIVVWWMYRGRGAVDSPWLLAYGMFAMIIGQGVDFSSKNRMVLVILLQLIIAMMFIINLLYEGIITSFMISSVFEDRLSTFDDVIKSKYNIVMDQYFSTYFNSIEEFKIHSSKIIVRDSNSNTSLSLSETVLNHKVAIVISCDVVEYYIDNKLLNGIMLSDYYYILPIKMLSTYIQLEASILNPFIEMLQQLMDACFEAGLPQIWKVFESQKEVSKSFSVSSDDPNYLQLKDLAQVFSILVIGYGLSTLVLLIEIFFHDMLSRLKLVYLARKLRNKTKRMAYRKKKQPQDVKYQKGALYYIIHRHQKSKRLKSKRLKVREIFVQPRTPAE